MRESENFHLYGCLLCKSDIISQSPFFQQIHFPLKLLKLIRSPEHFEMQKRYHIYMKDRIPEMLVSRKVMGNEQFQKI